jgi:hypothetical protein
MPSLLRGFSMGIAGYMALFAISDAGMTTVQCMYLVSAAITATILDNILYSLSMPNVYTLI